MQPSDIAPRDRLIVALDLPSLAKAEAMIARLGDSVTFYKIGYQLAFAGGLPLVRQLAGAGKKVFVDLKLHDISDDGESVEPLDMNAIIYTPKFRQGNRRFLTKRLWGCANEPPYYHHGLFTTMRQAVLAHSGEAKESRAAFQSSSEYEQDSLIEFLKSLQVLPIGTKDRIVDENYHKRQWPPPNL